MNSSKRYLYVVLIMMITIMTWWWFCLPDPLFNASYSTVLLDKNEQLLGARIAKDGQWRFPGNDLKVPGTFQQAIIQYEDKRFWYHNGIDIIAIGRAIRDNIRSGHITSGGSTLTMQTMRLARDKHNRSFFQKGIEMLWALRAELRFSKEDIIKMYASHAPFGGNVVGLSAASWRYFQKTPEQLSWAEACALAVLPNAPGLIHPGRNRDKLLEKRNLLLQKLYQRKIINAEEVSLAMQEPLPDKPFPLPDWAPHILSHHAAKGTTLHTTVDLELQQRLAELVQRHADILALNGVNNAALLLMETESGNVIAYIGNVNDEGKDHQNDVDIITSERSSGSILKPFLYCAALEEGLITPGGIIEDVPTYIRGYQPLNFTQQYMGMVGSDQALSMSLNVPAVRMLQDYGILPFKEKLESAGITTLHYSPDHYGLPLVLGGAEVTLWDVCGAYASMGRILSHALPYNYEYDLDDLHAPVIFREQKNGGTAKWGEGVWNAGAIWHTFEAMSTLRRPDQEGQWETFQSSKKIAWKTGTSFGYRDAWAVGITPKYTIGVWVGNADGEGRPGVIGLHAAAPILFDAIRMLDDDSEWWYTPYESMKPVVTCRESGWLAGNGCTDTDTVFIVKGDGIPSVCDFHAVVYTNEDQTYRYSPVCNNNHTVQSIYFIVPAVAETYYKRYNPAYKTMPPLDPACKAEEATENDLAIIYPRHGSRIYVPYEWDHKKSKAIFSAVHRSDTAHVYWHLDKKFLGKTKEFHQIEIDPSPGMHELVLQDEYGSMTSTVFEVLAKR